MNDKIVDFQAKRESHLHKRKEAKLDAMREAFRLARKDTSSLEPKRKKRRKSKK